MISTVIALPYEIARLPLAVLDRSLSGLSQTSGARVTLDRTIGISDKIAGAVLRNGEIAQRGADRLERSDTLQKATRLEQQAATRREQARETATAGSRQATRQRNAAAKTAVSGLQEADAVEKRGKQEAKTKAAKRAATKKTAAAKRAAARTATVTQAKKRADSAADAKKQTSQRAAKSELDEARATKQAADKTRKDADRLADLADGKKEDRKSS